MLAPGWLNNGRLITDDWFRRIDWPIINKINIHKDIRRHVMSSHQHMSVWTARLLNSLWSTYHWDPKPQIKLFFVWFLQIKMINKWWECFSTICLNEAMYGIILAWLIHVWVQSLSLRLLTKNLRNYLRQIQGKFTNVKPLPTKSLNTCCISNHLKIKKQAGCNHSQIFL